MTMLAYPLVLRNRPRMMLSITAGVVAAIVTPLSISLTARSLIGWDVAIWLYLVLITVHMARASEEDVRRNARRDDPSAGTVLFLVCMATVASIVAIVVELGSTQHLDTRLKLLHSLLTGMTLIGAWFLIPSIFTQHYARIYYTSSADARALVFPDAKIEPDYWDFMYFAFTIAVASQTADISLASRAARRVTLAQSLLSFYFNVAVLGLCVNIAASMFGS